MVDTSCKLLRGQRCWMTTKNTRRDFTDDVKREAVSLLRGAGDR